MSEAVLDLLRPRPTGGLIVTFAADAEPADQLAILRNAAGAGARSMSVLQESLAEMLFDAPAVLFEDAGIAVLTGQPDDGLAAIAQRLQDTPAVETVRPEFWLHEFDACDDSCDRTWGLSAVGADLAAQTGAGIGIAILDTGLDFGHPDFAGRDIVSKSFVAGQPAQDIQGHGTHCAGTAAGKVATPGVMRYGVAPDASLCIAKVLDDTGSGREADILNAMLWAIRSGCEVISMSLGRTVREGETWSADYERLGRMALDAGSLIVAAAGNDSNRELGFIAPVGAPANSPSIMAVGAVDQALKVADFSSGGVNPDGGEVDIAAPGVAVFSAVPRPRTYRTLSGTSMATPHVAGVAALWAEREPELRGRALWNRLTTTAQSLDAPPRDVGAGLVRAPAADIATG